MPKEPDSVEDLPAPVTGGGGGGGNPWLPVMAILILVPVVTFTLFEFYIFPKLNEEIDKVAAMSDGGNDEEGHGGGHGADYKNAERGEVAHIVAIDDVVANLSGALQSRYVKVSFSVESHVMDFETLIEHEKPKLIDATLSILSELTLQDLEKPATKNIVRNRLLNAFGQVLNGNVIDQLYFSEFVVQ